MSRLPGPLGLARWAVRRPRDAARVVRSQWLWVGSTVSEGLPGPIRRVVFRPLEAIAASAMHRKGDHAVAAPLRVFALHALGEDARATAVAERAGRDASPRTVTALARVVLASGDAVSSQRLLDARPDDVDVAAAGLRAEIALALGEYSEAAQRADAALAAQPDWDSSALRRVADRARGELALLQPVWRWDGAEAGSRAVSGAESGAESGAVSSPGRPAGGHVAPTRGRVLHLLTNSLPYRHGGYTVRAQNVARCQQAVGLDPRMVTRAGFPGNAGIARPRPVDVIGGVSYYRIRPDLSPGLAVDRVAEATADGLASLVAELRPALLQPTSNYVNGQVALAVGERLGVPVVYEVRGFLEETWLSEMGDAAAAGERYRAQRATETAVMRRADAIVTLSETMRSDILERGGIDPDRLVVIPNGVDVEMFEPGPRDGALAQALGIAEHETVIGYISSFTSYEGIEFLLDAVAELRRRGRVVRLLLVGDGDIRADLEARADRLGLRADGTAIFTGRVPHTDVTRYYRLIDLFVVPRTNDRVSRLVTPLKPYEAMSMAKPVVVSRVPALLELIREGETGCSFEPEDAGSLADVLDGLIDDPAARRRLGEAARTWVAEERTWAHNGRRYLELYQRLGVA